MKYPLVFKGSVAGLLFSVCALSASAQKIDEQELKTNVDKISNSTRQLQKLEPVTFKYDIQKYKHLNLPKGAQYGFLSNNVAAEFPAMVYETAKSYPAGKNNSKMISYTEVDVEKLIPVLVAAVKEQQEQIEFLKKELNLLKEKSK